ncbi:unnamed protein product [Sphagnum tenellum]
MIEICAELKRLSGLMYDADSWYSTPNNKGSEVCEDFHTSTKFISKILGRVIMVRHVNHIRHFEDGICSHMDYIVDASSLYLSFTTSSSFCFLACLVVFLHHQS